MKLGLFSILGIIFIVLKLTEVLAWSWIWVLSPFWIGAVFWIIIIALAVAFADVKNK